MLARELGTPGARRRVTISLDELGDAVRAQGNLGEAELLYREALELRRMLARELATPEAGRDLLVSLGRVADVARTQGRLGEAETLYREGLDLARLLADELGTPEALCDLSVSLGRVGDEAWARGSWGDAEKLYREGLAYAVAYRQQQPCPNADVVVAHLQEKLRKSPAICSRRSRRSAKRCKSDTRPRKRRYGRSTPRRSGCAEPN